MMTTESVRPRLPLFGITESIVGDAGLSVKAPSRVAVPPAVATDTSLPPVAAEASMLMLAVIWVALSTVKELTVIPGPKLTVEAPDR